MPTFRPATPDDFRATYEVFGASLMDLGQRFTWWTPSESWDAAEVEQHWQELRSIWEHLARTAEHFWVAEEDGQIIGYARSILRDGVRQLTEFFVHPDRQSARVGGELLRRAFPREGANHRVIIATAERPALVHYMKSGVYAQFPVYTFERVPEDVPLETDLTIEPLTASPQMIETIGTLDTALLGYRRDVDHQWMMTDRQGFLYSRGGEPVGYGYHEGPFALLDDNDFPAVLTHAEREAFRRGLRFELEIPLINHRAVDHVLARGFKMDSFIAYFMCDAPFGKYTNYIFFNPPFFT